jgi:K+-sensing histidine kinase KdpD
MEFERPTDALGIGLETYSDEITGTEPSAHGDPRPKVVDMTSARTSRFWRLAAQYFFGGIGLALLTFVCFRLELGLATTGFVYLILITLLSLMGSFIESAILSLIAVACLIYFFAPPIFSFQQ